MNASQGHHEAWCVVRLVDEHCRHGLFVWLPSRALTSHLALATFLRYLSIFLYSRFIFIMPFYVLVSTGRGIGVRKVVELGLFRSLLPMSCIPDRRLFQIIF